MDDKYQRVQQEGNDWTKVVNDENWGIPWYACMYRVINLCLIITIASIKKS